jgi:hypothetical protein
VLATIAIAVLAASPVEAGLFDDTDKLKGQLIVDVGDLESLDCPISGKYDCLSWPTNLYRFGYSQCMQVLGFYGGIGTKKALLAVDDAKTVSVFVLSSSFSSDIRRYSVVSYRCPDLF